MDFEQHLEAMRRRHELHIGDNESASLPEAETEVLPKTANRDAIIHLPEEGNVLFYQPDAYI